MTLVMDQRVWRGHARSLTNGARVGFSRTRVCPLLDQSGQSRNFGSGRFVCL